MIQKITRNQEINITNPYQTTTKKVLCLCSAGLLRSPTCANVLHEEFGYNTRSAGMDQNYALIPLTEALLYWADEVIVMDVHMKMEVHRLYEDINPLKAKYMSDLVHNLDIPDHFEWNQDGLREIIEDSYRLIVLDKDSN